MHILVLIFLPFLVFFHMKKTKKAIICLLLQITLVGWIPVSIWAFIASHQEQKERSANSDKKSKSDKKSESKGKDTQTSKNKTENTKNKSSETNEKGNS